MTKAHTIRNYPGLPDITGTDLARQTQAPSGRGDVEITEKQVTTVCAIGSYFGIQTPDVWEEPRQSFWRAASSNGQTFPREDMSCWAAA